MSNGLMPGNGGLASPSPRDQSAVQPGAQGQGPAGAPPANPLSGPPPGPTQMQQHYMSAEDEAAARFGKLKEAKSKMDETMRQFEKLTAFGDTVSMDDIIEAAAGMVAAGVPAVACASMLAEAPDQQSQLQAWVQEQISKMEPKAAELAQAYSQAGFSLGLASLKSIMASSAEEHFARRRLAAMPPQGRA